MGILGRLMEQRRSAALTKQLGSDWGAFYFQHGLWPTKNTAVEPDGSLNLADHDLRIPAGSKTGKEFVRAEYLFEFLRSVGGIRFEFVGDNVFALVDGLRIQLSKLGDIVTLQEVFLERLYNFESPGDYAFMDVGANIGLASLFFARNYPGSIYAYELVPTTAACARANFALNGEYGSRVNFNEFGIADKDQKITICVDRDDTAGNSIYQQHGQEKEEVTVKDAAPVLENLLEREQGKKLVVKLDAEGAEYSILRRWDQTGLIKNVSVLMMEWHRQEGEDLAEMFEVLKRNGFEWFERRHHAAPVGFLTAFRKP